MNELTSKWFPIASSTDLPFRHVFQAQLFGREYAVWRADDGNVNVWENRCLHRGVRLSIGINEGSELKCQYHGWRYANRTAGCTYIPAHPADAPARTICNNTYESHEKYGMVWTCEKPEEVTPNLKGFQEFTVLRPIPINTTLRNIENFLEDVGLANHFLIEHRENEFWCFRTKSNVEVSFFIQPQNSNISILRGIYSIKTFDSEKIKVLKYYNSLMTEIRDLVEKKYANLPKLPEIEPTITKLPAQLSEFPESTNANRQFNLRVSVIDKVNISKDIIKLKFKGIRGQLPTFHAGAHIDLQLQNGLVRQYSLTNGPGETDHYCIAVKIEKKGDGGSKMISDSISIGDILAISSPHNSFPLSRNSENTIFIAGGIGITPLLSMAKAMKSMRLNFEFHYFVQLKDQKAFEKDLSNLGNSITVYADFTINKTLTKVKSILAKPRSSNKIYVCGPGSMIKNTIKIATNCGWSDSNIRYEYFKNETKIDSSSAFKIELARSAMSLDVPSGKTILEVLRDNGVKLMSSCEQGACGTCKVRVLEGLINHQDVFLNHSERAQGDVMLTCVSRAKSKRLILDI